MKKSRFSMDITSIALNMLIFVACFVCVVIMFISGASFNNQVFRGFEIFKFFTVLSSLFLAIICLITAIYKIINLKDKTDIFPKWLKLLKLAATGCSFFTFSFCMIYLGNRFGYIEIFNGVNFVLHFVVPWIAVICFAVFDGKYAFNYKEMPLALIPPTIYGVPYGILTLTGVCSDVYSLNCGWFSILLAVALLAFYFLIIFLLQLLNKIIYKIFEIKATDSSFIDDPLELYTSKIFKAVFAIAPCAGLAASITYTICWIFKPSSFVPAVNVFLLLGFDIFVIFYTFLALFLVTKSFDENGHLKRKYLIEGKIVLAIAIPAQWNFLTYVFPAAAFWGYAFFFIILVAFFFDYKLVDIVSLAILASIAVSWIVNPNLLPPQDNQFVLNMTLRIVCLALGCISLHIATYFGGNFLVKQLEKTAEFDPLTLLRTRRFMYRYLDESFKDKNIEHLCIAMIDIDDFKSINDTFGHLTGDTILKDISSTIDHNVNESDCVFRYGGEEILILFKGDLIQSSKTLENILSLVRNSEYSDLIGERHLTISAGLVERGELETYEELIAEADKRLYYAKHHGKDQICSAKL